MIEVELVEKTTQFKEVISNESHKIYNWHRSKQLYMNAFLDGALFIPHMFQGKDKKKKRKEKW